MISAEDVIKKFGLKPHPKEGGYFKETYRCDESIALNGLPSRYAHPKAFSTAIYYLLTPQTQSSFHRLATDEIFHFYVGDPVTMVQLYPDGTTKCFTLGADVSSDQHVQLVVPRNTWQGAFLNDGGRWALMGTTMAPGFDYNDYEFAPRENLLAQYPQAKEFILRLTPTEMPSG